MISVDTVADAQAVRKEATAARPPMELGRVHGEEGQDVFGGFVEAGQDVNGLGREVASLASPLVGPHAPARVQDCLARVLFVQKDQVPAAKVKEGGAFACNNKKYLSMILKKDH